MKKALLTIGLAVGFLNANAQLNISTAMTPTQLVQTVLLGTGVQVSNVTYTGAAVSRGSFSCGGTCNLGVASGIYLSSGQINSLANAPASMHHSTNVLQPGDAMLNAIVAPRVTFDATVLEFDFSVAADSVQFRYVFGSEEYNDYANTNFNDVFAFFISGPGIVGAQNIALVPGTTTPVSINTVNNGGPVGGVASGPCMNCTYYYDNVGGASVFMDGFTTVLTAKSAVQPCEVYHIKLAIADASDEIFDSGVFLEANSFSALGQIALFANGVAQQNNATVYACQGDSVQLCLNPAQSYNWSNNATTQCIWVNQANVTPNHMYSGYVFGPPSCFAYTTTVNLQWVVPTATITPSGPLALCPGSTVTLNANAGNTYLWNNGATTQSITVGTAGSYTVTVSNGPNCSATSAPVQVTVGSATASIAGVLSLCNGANTLLTANLGLSYLWSNAATTQSINVTTAGAYTVTVTQAGGCTASALVNVTVNPNPVPAIAGTLNFCTGANTILDAGAGYSTYSWNTGATTQNLTVLAGGTYTVTVTSAAGCSGSTSAAVVMNPLPVPVIAGTLGICQGANTILDAGAGYATYSWSSGVTTQTITTGTAGAYTVTVTNAAGCSGSTSTAVVVNPLPTPNITGTFAFCAGSNTLLNAPAGFTGYSWNTGATTANITVLAGNTYTVTVTDANGCTGSDAQLVTVNPNPVPVIAGTIAFCQGANSNLNAGAGYSGYAWSSGQSTAIINVTTAGPYAVTVTDINGCTGSTSVNITVNPLPVPAIAGTLAFCQGANSNLSATAGYSSYAWSTGATTQAVNVTTAGLYIVTVTDGFGCTGSTNAAVVVNALPIPNITGTFAFCAGSNTLLNAPAGFAGYSWNTGATTANITVLAGSTYTVTVTDLNGCTGSDAQLVTVNPNPVPVIAGTTAFCQGANSNLNAGAGYSGYAWSSGQSTAIINVTTAGPYAVTVTDINGCTGSTSVNITVNPLPVPAIAGTLAFCQGANSNLSATAGYSSYAWSTGATTQALNVTTSGIYIVTVTDAFGCTGSTNAAVVVNALPTPNITGTFTFCAGSNTLLNAPAGFAGYSWNTGATTANITVLAGNTYTVTVTDLNGCTGSDAQLVTVNPNPVPAIVGTTAFCDGANSNLDAGAGYSGYAWSSGQSTAIINVTTAGPYAVTVTDINGCTGTTSVNITVNPLPTPAIAGTLAFCQGANSNLNAGAGYSSYSWNTGATTQALNVTTAGTYTVTVSNVFGCTASTNAVVVVNALPAPAIAGPAAICIGNNALYDAGAGYATYQWNTGSTAQTINTTGGTYTVTVTSAAGCSGSANASLVINPLPVPAINGITAICQGTNTTFDAGAGYSAYSWSTGAITQSISPGLAGSYTVTVTDLNGCSNNTSINLTVNANPVPSIVGTLAFCQGQNSNLNAGAGYTTYNWSNGSTSQIINVTAGGNYQVTVTDGNGCNGSTASVVTVHPNPTPAIAGGTGICQGSSVVLDAGTGYATYNWNTGATAQNITVSTGGNYSVTVTSAFGCIGTTSTVMVVNQLPVPAAVGITAVCQGFNTTFDAGAGYSGYNWSNGASTQTILTGIAGTYTVTVTDLNGCTGSTDITLTVNANPVPSINGTTAFCQGQNSNLAASAGFPGYQWNTGATTTGINVSTAGNYTVTVTDPNGCIGTASVAIVVNALPVPIISGTFTICDGASSIFNAGAGYASYLWSDGSTSQTLSVGTAATYSVTVVDVNGCVGATSQTLSVNPLPTAAITGDAEICFGVSSQLEFTFTGTAPFTYTYFNGAANITPAPAPAGTASITIAPGNTTTYSLVSISDANCVGTVAGTALVTVNQLPEPVIVGDLSICDGETSELNAPAGFVSYTWSNGAGQPSILTGAAGIYTVTVVDQNGCSGISPSVNLAVHMIPVVSFTNDTSITCEVPYVNFSNLSTYDPGSSFSWTFGDGGIATDVNPSHLYANPGNYVASLVITTPFGCTSSTTNPVSVVFHPLPVADFIKSDAAVTVFNGKMQFVDRSSYAIQWLWEFGDGESATTQNAQHYYSQVGDFRVRLTVWNIAGCEDIYEEVITVNPFYIPNAFTPNGDGINDDFFTSGIPYELDVQSYSMQIFNRWGQVVYTGTSVKNPWNGYTAEGDKAPEGTYAYKLNVVTRGGKEHSFAGQVNLIR